MIASKDKISLRQAMIILFTITYSPSLILILHLAGKEAKQAAWLSPLITFVIMIPIILIFQSIYKKYADASFTEIIEDIFGKILGKIVTVFFIIPITLILTTNIILYSNKLVTTVYPNVPISIFIIIMLITIAIIVNKGRLTVLARMSEIMFTIIVMVFLAIFVLALKDIKISNLMPISSLDIYPIFKTNIGIMTVWAHIPFLFLFSDYINNKEKINKICIPAIMMLTFLTIILIVVTIGLIGASTTELSSFAYITAIKEISVFNTLERLEAADLGLWILSDFMLISILLFTVLNMYKSLFKLSDTKPLINIYLLLTYFLALMIAKSNHELDVLGFKLIVPLNIFFGFIIPILVFIVGKIRKKI